MNKIYSEEELQSAIDERERSMVKVDLFRIALRASSVMTREEIIKRIDEALFDEEEPKKFDPKDPEELERFKNAPDGYPDSFKNSQEQETSDNQTNYKRQ
jgi:hypothetical protein